MLARFKKIFSAEAESNTESVDAEAVQTKEEESMTTTNEQPELTAEDNTADLASQLDAKSVEFNALQAKFEELTAKFEAAQEQLAALESVKEDLVAKAAEAKFAARKEKLEDAVGTVKAAELLSSLSVLDDAAFDSVVSSMKVNLDKEAASETFTENGVTAEASETKPKHFKDYIKTK